MKRLFLLPLLSLLFLCAHAFAQDSTQTARRVVVGITNDTVTGTTVNRLAKLAGAPSKAIIAATTDTDGVIGVVVSNAGTSGVATIQTAGQVGTSSAGGCDFDGATTAGDYVQISSTSAGKCHDAGSTYPTTGQVIGRVPSTNVGAGTHSLVLTPGRGAPATALADPGGNGIVVRTAAGATTNRSVGASAPVTVSNADATAGNPTVACATCVTSGASLASGNVVTGAGGQGAQDSGKAAPSGAFVGTSDSQSLTNKKLGSLTTNGPVYTSAGDGTLNSEAQLSKARGGTGADLSATGGAHFFLRQNSAGGAIDVVQPAASDLSNGTTGSNAVALADSPVFTTQITTPVALGGSAAGSSLILQSTSGTGTATTAGVQIAGGTNGGTTIVSFLNNGNVGVNTSSPVFDSDSAGRYFSMDGGSSSFGDLGVGGNQSGTSAAIAEIGFFNSNLGTAEKRNAFVTVRNDGATNSGKIQIGTANAGALSINLQIDHFGNFVAAGTAPTVASTGTGSSPTNTVDTGDNDFVGTITVTAGTAPSSSGTVTLTFAGTLGTNAPVCQWTLGNGTGTFNARATAINGTQSTSSSVVNWDNNAVNLTATSTYKFNYNCTGK